MPTRPERDRRVDVETPRYRGQASNSTFYATPVSAVSPLPLLCLSSASLLALCWPSAGPLYALALVCVCPSSSCARGRSPHPSHHHKHHPDHHHQPLPPPPQLHLANTNFLPDSPTRPHSFPPLSSLACFLSPSSRRSSAPARCNASQLLRACVDLPSRDRPLRASSAPLSTHPHPPAAPWANRGWASSPPAASPRAMPSTMSTSSPPRARRPLCLPAPTQAAFVC